MTDKARELLERSADLLEWQECFSLAQEIRGYLAQPEVKREALSEETIRWTYEKNLRIVMLTEHGWFNDGVRFAEKHHGIGGGDE